MYKYDVEFTSNQQWLGNMHGLLKLKTWIKKACCHEYKTQTTQNIFNKTGYCPPKNENIRIRQNPVSEAYLGLYQAYMMELLVKIGNSFSPLAIFTKRFFVDILMRLCMFFFILRCERIHCTKKSFSLKIFSVNVTKSAVDSAFGHIYWRSP